MKKLGYDLIKKRQAAGLTQIQLAKQLGLAQSSYNHYESGKSTPKGERKTIIENWLKS